MDEAPISKPKLGAGYFKLFGASVISNLGDGIGAVAYPWLASAITRDPLLISLVAVVQRLPWLIFSLPAGVITDRYDRRWLMVGANILRTIMTIGVALAVLAKQGILPGPDQVGDPTITITTDMTLYAVVLLAAFLLGMAEVIHDNSAQTFMPAVVHKELLEKANGRLWSVEQVANNFVGPPLGALLLVAAFSVPFFVDAATFAVSAALVALIRPLSTPEPGVVTERTSWITELKEGFGWLWKHDLLRPMAIILGLLNMAGMISFAVFVLFAQEVLEVSPTVFAILGTGAAIGGIVGGWAAPYISKRIGSGASLALALTGGAVTSGVIGVTSWWPITWLMFAIFAGLAVLWNVITVSLRQTIIPDRLLGRVNSVYRFFAWGMMPIGAVAGGLIVTVTESVATRDLALRMPWLVAAGLQVVLFVFARPRLTTEKIETARSAAG